MMAKTKKAAKKVIRKVRHIVEELKEEIERVIPDTIDVEYLPEHEHKWVRGLLPQNKYVKTCECGKVEEIDFDTFNAMR
jgi:DNA polymerase elongation subunit (family B)